MFERFTEPARQVVVLAQEEARAFKHNYIGTEHILLGIARENQGVASSVLLNLGADAQMIRSASLDLLEGYDVRQRVSPSPLERGQPVTISVSKSESRGDGPGLWLARNAYAILLPAALGVGILIGWLIWA